MSGLCNNFTPATAVVFTPPFHPDYGLSHETRVEVVRLVLNKKASIEVAAMSYNLSPTTVRNWIKRAVAPHEETI